MKKIKHWQRVMLSLVLLGGGVVGAATVFYEWVGIGTETPQMMLDVAGGVKMSDDNDTCDTNKKGTIRYSTSNNRVEGCNGSSWTPFVLGDDVPDSFSFTDQTELAASSLVTSNVLLFSGFNIPVSVSISGSGSPEYRICNDPSCSSISYDWGTTSHNIESGQFLQLRMTTSSEDLTALNATVTVGSLSDTWTTTTADSLFAFTYHTFTSCGVTGRTGPTVTDCRSAYNTTWDENASYFDVTSGIQYWTAPRSGNFVITALGAQGASSTSQTKTGGKGARMKGLFTLTKGEQIKILVGQQGTTDGNRSGGGGGTFVVKSDNTKLLIAGGGGGSGYNNNGQDGVTTEAGTDPNPNPHTRNGKGGSNGGGGGGGGAGSGGGGAGFCGDGGDVMIGDYTVTGGNGATGCYAGGNASGSGTAYSGVGGDSFLNGGAGADSDQDGGFGGGGGVKSWNTVGGGGGGYSGGGGAGYADTHAGGGGGGSYNAGTYQDNTAGVNEGDGKVIISLEGYFLFEDVPYTGQGVLVESNIIQTSGIATTATASITGDGGTPEFRICSDGNCTSVLQTWGSTSQSISNGQYVQLRVYSPSTADATYDTTLTINGISDTWSVTSSAAMVQGYNSVPPLLGQSNPCEYGIYCATLTQTSTTEICTDMRFTRLASWSNPTKKLIFRTGTSGAPPAAVLAHIASTFGFTSCSVADQGVNYTGYHNMGPNVWGSQPSGYAVGSSTPIDCNWSTSSPMTYYDGNTGSLSWSTERSQCATGTPHNPPAGYISECEHTGGTDKTYNLTCTY